MKKNKKRPQYVIDLINEVNKALELWGVKDVDNELIIFITNYLMERRMYEGFNMYKHGVIDGQERLVLAGTFNREQYDCLQIW